jgi:hypothetical protein
MNLARGSFSEEVLHPNLKRQLENLGFEEPYRKYSVLQEGLILELFSFGELISEPLNPIRILKF